MRSLVRTGAALAIMGITPASASDYIQNYVPKAEEVGTGRLNLWFWDIYDATLFAPSGQYDPEKAYALQISYLRDISGEKIADHSVDEMRNQGFEDRAKLDTWYEEMVNIFPDVDKGITLTAVFTPDGKTIFYRNGEDIGTIDDAEFSQQFANIWLSEKTRSPDLRRKLLGQL